MILTFLPVREMGEQGIEFLYMLMAERMTEPHVNISAKQMPSYREHSAFVQEHAYTHWFIISAEREGVRDTVGYVSATARNEIGIVLLKAFRRKGIGKAALIKFMAEYAPLPAKAGERAGNWLANVAPSNHASHALFKKLGGKIIQITYQL